MSFKYYLYISDSKVDMLLPQIDPAFDTRNRSEFGVNLKVLTAKRVTQPPADQRIARLEQVVRHLRDLGGVDEPGQFFSGLLPMRWEFPTPPGSTSSPSPRRTDSSLVFFGGQSENTVVGLGGSRRHVLGSAPDPPGPAPSQLPELLEELGVSSALEDEYVADALDAHLDGADIAALARVRGAVAALRGPAQNLEFVAKRLLHGRPLHGQNVLLGSPVYVAQVD